MSVPTHAAYSKNMRRDTHAEENDERTQDMMGPGVMPSTATQEEWLLFLCVGPILSFLASPRYGRPKKLYIEWTLV